MGKHRCFIAMPIEKEKVDCEIVYKKAVIPALKEMGIFPDRIDKLLPSFLHNQPRNKH